MTSEAAMRAEGRHAATARHGCRVATAPRSEPRLRRLRHRLAVLAAACCLAAPASHADTLPLPANLIGFASGDGERLLIESQARAAYWSLAMQFVTQKNQAFCGVASLVMVLNALKVPAPPTPGFEAFDVYTQDNALDDRTEKVLPVAVLMRRGMTLDQFGRIAELRGLRAEVHHAAASSVADFRSLAAAALATPNRHVVVNYLRRALGQERGGHISPLAAYDAKADRFLLLDVSRYKYPPVWVTAEDLYGAMNTVDGDNDGQTRGFVLIERSADRSSE